MDVVGIRRTVDAVSDHLEDVLDTLSVVYVDGGHIIHAGVPQPLKRELQISIPIEAFEARNDPVARYRLVQSRRDGMEGVRMGGLFYQRSGNLDKEPVLFD